MMHFNFIFEKYNWEIHVYILFNDCKVNEILDKLELLDCPDNILRRAEDRIINCQNSGFTYTNPKYKESIMVINDPDSINELIDTYNHEKNHVEMHICKKFNIDPYSELASYLSGQLANNIFNVILGKMLKK